MTSPGFVLRVLVGVTALLVSGAMAPGPAQAQAISGEAVYSRRCASCHDQINPRIPTKESLQKMPAARIVRALDTGAMMNVAFTMHHDERQAVATYLGAAGAVEGPPPSAFCAARTIQLAAKPAVTWNGWSPGSGNTRFQAAAAAGLSAEQVARLKLKWAFGFDGDVSAYSQPTVLDGHLFVGSAAGLVHAMRPTAAVSSGRSRPTAPCGPPSWPCPSAAGTSCCSAT